MVVFGYLFMAGACVGLLLMLGEILRAEHGLRGVFRQGEDWDGWEGYMEQPGGDASHAGFMASEGE
jgi:hypothetical protein